MSILLSAFRYECDRRSYAEHPDVRQKRCCQI